MQGLEELTTIQLLEEHNRLSEPTGILKGWKGKKVDLATRVAALRAKKRPGARPIKAAAYELLLAVDYMEPGTNRKVGFDYDQILKKIQEEFPGCSTTDKCLRWYSVALNESGAILPYRPRRSPKRAEKKAAEAAKP